MDDPPRFTGQFDRPAGEAGRAWSVFLPRFTNGVEVSVNGVVILDSRRDPAANRPDRNTPEIAVIPASVLRDGANDVAIRLFIWGPITGFLDRVCVGPDELLRPGYDLRTLFFVTLPVVFSAWQAILAVILGDHVGDAAPRAGLWRARRGDGAGCRRRRSCRRRWARRRFPGST